MRTVEIILALAFGAYFGVLTTGLFRAFDEGSEDFEDDFSGDSWNASPEREEPTEQEKRGA